MKLIPTPGNITVTADEIDAVRARLFTLWLCLPENGSLRADVSAIMQQIERWSDRAVTDAASTTPGSDRPLPLP